jgi:hypothetical protein
MTTSVAPEQLTFTSAACAQSLAQSLKQSSEQLEMWDTDLHCLTPEKIPLFPNASDLYAPYS